MEATLMSKRHGERQELRGFWWLELCLYGLRELAQQHYDLNQLENIIWRVLLSDFQADFNVNSFPTF